MYSSLFFRTTIRKKMYIYIYTKKSIELNKYEHERIKQRSFQYT